MTDGSEYSNEEPNSQDAFEQLVQHINTDEIQTNQESVFNTLTPTSSFEIVQPASMDVLQDLVDQSLIKRKINCDASSPADSGYNQPQSNDTVQSSPGISDRSFERSSPPPAMYEIESQRICIAPSIVNFPGNFKFSTFFEHTASAPKAADFTHSSSLEKLYVKMGVPCPVQFICSALPPEGSYVRAKLVYSNNYHIHETVCRCPNHETTDTSNVSKHILRVVSPKSVKSFPKYEKIDGRFSVAVPFQQASTDPFITFYKFMCLSSCVGGMNRRPVKLIFTLEDTNGMVLGRSCVEVKICSSPGRDRKVGEGNKRKHENVQQTQPNPGKRLRLVIDQQDRQHRFLRVRQENYQIMHQINEALNLASMATENQRERCREEEQNVLSAILAKFFDENN